MRLFRPDLHGLTGAYAVDALDAGERERFEQHLGRCSSCEHEVRGMQETATRLAVAVAAPPPAGLKAAVLTAAAQTRQ
ncbi:MAG: zf-HC2 domain-containing protein, partial [Actinomycetota bacterium]|nr:zf-HC2 domain-containing protein [Actinomycetota bacterium]